MHPTNSQAGFPRKHGAIPRVARLRWRRLVLALGLWGAANWGALAQTSNAAPGGASPAIPDPLRAGQEIARRLRTAGPEKSARFDGLMTVVRAGRTNQLPIRSRIEVTGTNWVVRYIAGTGETTDMLTIVRAAGQPAQYFRSSSTNSEGPRLTEAQLFHPYAGSDFWPVDLGLDFLAWPTQRQLDHQMRRGRACRVLESVNPSPKTGGYQRVVSWVDVETDGILKAQAYDVANQKVKEFLVGSFRKIDGQYQLEEMSMTRTGARDETRIRFDLSR